ncbi:hypothetical protein LY71_12449 [Geodermatophilus tzadiensis]|uniref:DUF4177 domain-containing protein n=1 Tax=Geodermatophilus tzadiensis TaxID=1137988 RepID=A0A2T0SUU1_9ACTN|nr:hypothetical protein [Geodermatophilus tzadiensis]PRY37184.1 hypothetical protein LY71_12449 [Geodermatophilus tzadiensis]
MERWETLLVRAEAGHNAQFVLLPSQPDVDGMQTPNYASTVALLNQLGQQGWRLVSADMSDNRARTGVYWLSRRVPEPPQAGGGWVASV